LVGMIAGGPGLGQGNDGQNERSEGKQDYHRSPFGFTDGTAWLQEVCSRI